MPTVAVTRLQTVTLTAEGGGASRQASLEIRPVRVALVSLSPGEVTGGQALQGREDLQLAVGEPGRELTLRRAIFAPPAP